jgi:hypothetical protein
MVNNTGEAICLWMLPLLRFHFIDDDDDDNDGGGVGDNINILGQR